MKENVPMSKKIGTVFFSLWVVVAYILAQLVVTYIGLMPIITESLAEAGGDLVEYQEIYMDKIANSGALLANLQGVASIVSFIVVAVWFFFGYVKKDTAGREARKKNGITKKMLSLRSFVFYVVGSVFIFTAAILIRKVTEIIMPDVVQAVTESMNLVLGGNAFLGVIIALVLAPIAEEITVRGIVVRKAEKSFGLIGCMVISAIMFGILHMNPIQGLYVLPMGLFWGYLSYKYKSVIPSIICHFLNNLSSILLAGIVDYLWLVLILFVVSLVAFILIGKKMDFGTQEAETSEAMAQETV